MPGRIETSTYLKAALLCEVELTMERNPVKTVYAFHNFRNQFYAVFSANFIMFSHGCIIGWVAPALQLLSSDESPLKTGPITLEQMSWIGSMNCIGAIFGSFTFGCFTSFVGCKRAMTFLGIPAICYWLTIMHGDTVYLIIFARFLGGWGGGGIFSITVLYLVDVADDKIRGTLGSIAPLSRNVGMLISYILGAFLDYNQLPYIFIIIPAAYMINFILLPNTPQYLVRKGEFEKAEKALKYYKGCDGSTVAKSAALFKELDRLKTLANQRQADKKWHFSDFYERNAIRALSIAIVLSSLNQFSGCFTFLTYAGRIVSKTGNSVNPYTSSIIFGVLQIFGTLFTTQLADRLGRKVLLIVSLSGTVLGQTALSIFTYLQEHEYDLSMFKWVPVTSISFVIFISSLGIIPLSSVCTVEVLPVKIRTIGMSINIVSLNISAFLISKYFPIMSESVGIYGCLTFMSVVCIMGIIFVIFVMEETNGRNLDTIGNRRPRVTSSNSNQTSGV